MATDYTASNIGSGVGQQSKLNAEWAAIQAAMERLLNVYGDSTHGTNAMQADLDMNDNKLLNVPAPTLLTDVVRLGDLSSLGSAVQALTTLLTDSAGKYASDNVEGAMAELLTLAEAASESVGEGGSLIGLTQGGTVQDAISYVTPQMFGAVGDGVTNDTTAFQLMAANVVANDGGVIVIPPGIYIVGRQSLAGATGLGYAYLPEDILKINGCSGSVSIEAHGATLKADPTLKFGSFDPVTGAVHNPSLPFTDYDYAAHAYWGMVQVIDNTGKIFIRGLECDGNEANVTLGGLWGDTGRQLAAYGIYAHRNSNVQVANVNSHHHCLDGMAIGYAGLTIASPKYAHKLENCSFDYNARQGLSWVGGTGLVATGCTFNHTGQGTFSSSPGAGLDIEAEASICRNGVFTDCEFINNTGGGMIADSGDGADCTFNTCTFVGVDTYSIWPNKPGIVFNDCNIYGAVANQYASFDARKATKFNNCAFYDGSYGAYTLYKQSDVGILGTALSAPVYYTGCSFYATVSKFGRVDHAKLKDCYFLLTAGTGYITNKDQCLVAYSTQFLGGNRIESNITVNPPADAFYIAFAQTEDWRGENTLVNTAGTVRWGSWSVGAGGFTGHYGSRAGAVNETASQFLEVHKRLRHDLYYGANKIGYSTAAPGSGAYTRGDLVLNESPSVDANGMVLIGWRCTVSGSPGTWVAQYTDTLSPTATATTAQLADIAHAINTTDKSTGRRVTNTTTGIQCYAAGAAAGSVWNEADGTLEHTPV